MPAVDHFFKKIVTFASRRRVLIARSDLLLLELEALAAVIIELGAGSQNERLLPGIEGAFALVVAGVFERVPMLAFFDTFQIVVGIGDLFKEALFVEIVPELALPHRQGLAGTPGLPSFADYGKIAVAVDLAFFEVDLPGPGGARESKHAEKQTNEPEQRGQVHDAILLSD